MQWRSNYKLVGGFWVKCYLTTKDYKNRKAMLKTFKTGRK